MPAACRQTGLALQHTNYNMSVKLVPLPGSSRWRPKMVHESRQKSVEQQLQKPAPGWLRTDFGKHMRIKLDVIDDPQLRLAM